MEKQKLVKKVQEFFEEYKDEEKVVVVSDGNLFFESKISLARSHANRNGRLKVMTLTRAEALGTTKPAAEEKAEEEGKETAAKKETASKPKKTTATKKASPENRAADDK